MRLNAATVFAGEGSIVTAFVPSYAVEHVPCESVLRRGERKATACHPLRVSTFGPARVAGENRYSPWYTDGKMMFITEPEQNQIGTTFLKGLCRPFSKVQF